MAQYPSAAAGDSNLYIAVNKTSTTLTDNPLAAGAVTVNVLDASAFPSVGAISIDAEIIHYTGKTGTSFTGCTRGFDGTTDVAHTVSTPVYHKVIADHHNVLKEEIKAIESDLIACKAALNDVDTPASTSSDVKDRLDQIVSQLKLISGGTNWYSSISNNLTQLLPLSGGALTGTLLHPSGSASAPSVSFTSYTTTGLYAYSGGGLGLSVPTGGDLEVRINSVQFLNLTPTLCYIKPQIQVSAAGTASAPDYSFLGDTDLGLFRIGPNTLGLVASDGFSFGGSALRAMIGDTAKFQIEGTTYGTSTLAIVRNTNSFSPAGIVLAKSRGTTNGAVDIVTNGDALGIIYFAGADGTGMVQAASIRAVVDGTPGTNDMPTKLEFLVSPDGSVTPTQAARAVPSGTSVAFEVKGTATNDSADAGWVGEYIESSATNVNAFGTGVYGDATSISLTAGDWDISAGYVMLSSGATWTSYNCGISTTSGNSGTGLVSAKNLLSGQFASTSTAVLVQSVAIPTYRLSLNATTTVYCKFRCNYSAGTPQADVHIHARRVR